MTNPLATAIMAAILLLGAVPAHAHGAIAFGHIPQDQAVAYGFAWDYSATGEAQEAAMNACLDSGGSDCTVLAWFQNGCGALAMDQYGMAQGKGARTQDQAEARALRTCEAAEGVGCAVAGSACVSPGASPDTWSGSENVLAVPEEGSSDRTADAPRDEALTREERMQVQQGLAALGFDTGPADGVFGPRTRSAILEWQQEKGLETTGYLSRDEAEILAAAGTQDQPAVSRETAEQDGPRNQVIYFAAAGPKCTEFGAACWQEIQSQPGCYIWTEYYRGSDYTADWTDECSGDTAHGSGSYSLFSESGHYLSASGSVLHGKQSGHWVMRYDITGAVHEGPFVDGQRNGHWVLRFVNTGSVQEGPFVDGKRNGHWVERNADGDVREGPYVDGERNGHWVERFASGAVWERPYVGYNRNGHWVNATRAATSLKVPLWTAWSTAIGHTASSAALSWNSNSRTAHLKANQESIRLWTVVVIPGSGRMGASATPRAMLGYGLARRWTNAGPDSLCVSKGAPVDPENQAALLPQNHHAELRSARDGTAIWQPSSTEGKG